MNPDVGGVLDQVTSGRLDAPISRVHVVSNLVEQDDALFVLPGRHHNPANTRGDETRCSTNLGLTLLLVLRRCGYSSDRVEDNKVNQVTINPVIEDVESLCAVIRPSDDQTICVNTVLLSPGGIKAWLDGDQAAE